jgi:alkylhydroperoxidase/carboxymuconolactone decarboxylase family protein YurZ
VIHDHEELLRRLALCDEEAAAATLTGTVPRWSDDDPPGLDARSLALTRLAGLIAVSSSTASYQWCVADAIAAGVRDDEMVAVLVTVAPVVGTARVVAAAADLALALGYDLDSAFEGEVDRPPPP